MILFTSGGGGVVGWWALNASAKKDDADAREFFKRAAAMNFAPALHALAVIHE